MQKIVQINALSSGAHRNQSFYGSVPEGWALIPADMDTPNFPYGEVEASEVDGVMTVTKWTPGEVPAPKVPALTPAQKRKDAYTIRPAIEWEGEMLTVTQAATLRMYYDAEGSAKADELRTLIVAAKQSIRDEYPDEEVSV